MFGFFKSKTFPEAEWISEAESLKPTFTPDLSELQETSVQLLFEYGEAKTGHWKEELIQDTAIELASSAYTAKPFSLWKRKLGPGTYPIAMHRKFNFITEAKVRGELFAINPESLIALDEYRCNGVLYRRERTKLIVPSRQIYEDVNGEMCETKPRACVVEAWMYVGVYDKWIDRFDGGYFFGPCRIRHVPDRFQQFYYEFTDKDYDELSEETEETPDRQKFGGNRSRG